MLLPFLPFLIDQASIFQIVTILLLLIFFFLLHADYSSRHVKKVFPSLLQHRCTYSRHVIGHEQFGFFHLWKIRKVFLNIRSLSKKPIIVSPTLIIDFINVHMVGRSKLYHIISKVLDNVSSTSVFFNGKFLLLKPVILFASSAASVDLWRMRIRDLM